MDEPRAEDISKGTQLRVRTNKIIVGHEQGDTPELSPLFVNNTEVIVVGTDFYIDLGMVQPDAVTAAGVSQGDTSTRGAAPVNIDFFVLQRVAMSESTFRTLIQRATELILRMDADRRGGADNS
jgi:hypothetical protein